PYLVRRLLENGANTSFVNKITDESLSPQALVADPRQIVAGFDSIPHTKIPQPVALYGDGRKNSMGINLANDSDLRRLGEAMNAAIKPWTAEPLVPGAQTSGKVVKVSSPADRRVAVGEYREADSATVDRALTNAVAAQPEWDRLPAASRAAILEHAADLMEARMPEFMAICTREAGKTLPDGVAEVREAVDFLRYYAQQARRLFGHPEKLPGPTGE